jgi:hypothetical protein
MHKYDGKWAVKKLVDVYYCEKKDNYKKNVDENNSKRKIKELRDAEAKYINIYQRQGKQLINTQKVEKYKMKINVTKPIIDQKVKDSFVVQELKDCYRIRWSENHKQKEKKIRFGKRHTKEEAYKIIQQEKEKLEEKMVEIDDIFDDY